MATIRTYRALGIPASWLFGSLVRLRNRLYDLGWLKTTQPSIPTICIGNLSTGGTGKTPCVEYVVALLKDRYQIATLSRGYKRQTRGFLLAGQEATSADIGDEPLQILKKFTDITVAVGEDRVLALSKLLYMRPETEVVVLDDAFQHRAVKAHLNILLTDFSQPYPTDHMLPLGNLRDHPSSASRADVIIVTKCPGSLTEIEANIFAESLGASAAQHIFFSTLAYPDMHDFQTGAIVSIPQRADVLLVSGIANPRSLRQHLEDIPTQVWDLSFPDHHAYDKQDIHRIIKCYQALPAKMRYIVTTEKDAVRLAPFRSELQGLSLLVQPVSHAFMFSDKARFDEIINTFMEGQRMIGALRK